MFDLPILSEVTHSLSQLNLESAFDSSIAPIAGAHPSVASSANQLIKKMDRLSEFLVQVKQETQSIRHQVLVSTFDENESRQHHVNLSDLESGLRMHVQILRYFRDRQVVPDTALGEYKDLMIQSVDNLIRSINKILVDVVALNNHYRQFYISFDVEKAASIKSRFNPTPEILRAISENTVRILREKKSTELAQFSE